MRKTKIHAILTDISQIARDMRKDSDGTPMCRYNDVEFKKRLLKAKDAICILCTKLQDECFI